jgi:general secretion pathway protein I
MPLSRRVWRTRACQAQAGFSLLEVMVAFAILALSLGVLLRIFSSSMNATALSADYARAVTLAEARLNSVGADIPLRDGTYSGDAEDGIDWIVDIQSLALPGWLGENPPLQPYRVRAVATWPGISATQERRVVLETLRLGEVGL